ncbi:MAG: molybdate ABC transporter substrate-binding protein [Desulfuromonadales bacterium]|nr:molybdate ABC transporter substrate-binding protein [Desulfuromonadales bacterium]MBN2793035.1 molybdate ABC transporter substrate-binding protein [Desulfuromonadales bacterium]
MSSKILLLFVFFLLPSITAASEVHISAATSLTDAVSELVINYEQMHPDIDLQMNFAPSGTLAKQIIAGAPTDIYISANPKWMEYVQQQKMIEPNSQQILVYNNLVFVGIPNSKITSLQDLLTLRRIALASPQSAPAGKYAEQVLLAAGLYQQLSADKKLIPAKDVRQALLYADRGEVDGAFVYRSDALLAKQARILFTVPQELYPQVAYPVALTLSGSNSAGAQEFLVYLLGADAQSVFKRYGFIAP